MRARPLAGLAAEARANAGKRSLSDDASAKLPGWRSSSSAALPSCDSQLADEDD